MDINPPYEAYAVFQKHPFAFCADEIL